MTPGAHLLFSWLIATGCKAPIRERRLIALAGIVPDLDGLGVIIDVLSHDKTSFYENYHHVFCHNLLFGVFISALFGCLAKSRKFFVFMLSMITYHIHLLSDLMGSRGPDGFQWPIPYLVPFSRSIELAWDGQWLLNGWQNNSILIVLIACSVLYAAKHRRSFVEVISIKLDREIFKAVATRWPA